MITVIVGVKVNGNTPRMSAFSRSSTHVSIVEAASVFGQDAFVWPLGDGREDSLQAVSHFFVAANDSNRLAVVLNAKASYIKAN